MANTEITRLHSATPGAVRRPPSRRRLIAAGAVLLAVLVVAIGVERNSGGSSLLNGTALVRGDNFSGAAGAAPNPAIWSVETGGGGWGNGELECYTDSRSTSALDGRGHLLLTANYDPGQQCSDGTYEDYTSARLTTQNRLTAKYGTLAVRAELPSGSGVWPAFWALGSNHSTVGWPESGEIDTVEAIGKSNVVHAAVHGPSTGDPATPYNVDGSYDVGAPLDQAFHVYSVTWSPTQLAYAVDGHVYRTITKKEVEAVGTWVFDHPFYLLLDLAVGGTFPGYPDGSTQWPQVMTIDWVHVST